jgi:hypothetical protein
VTCPEPRKTRKANVNANVDKTTSTYTSSGTSENYSPHHHCFACLLVLKTSTIQTPPGTKETGVDKAMRLIILLSLI